MALLHSERLVGIKDPITACVLSIEERARVELGVDTLVVCGFRDNEWQNALWAQGRFALDYVNELREKRNLYLISEEENKVVTNAMGGESAHNFELGKIKGAAVDLVASLNGTPQWKNEAFFKIVGEQAHKHGLIWGVVHKGQRIDLGHIETTDWKNK